MLEISVKTLDGQTRKFSVPDDMTVADFKQRISEPVNIPADRQRIIFQGRLLANETRLSEMDLNGRAVHVVERTPPTHQPEGQNEQRTDNTSHARRHHPEFIMAAGSFEMPADIQQVVQQAVNQFGPAARGASVETRRMPGGAPGLEVHIRLPPPGSNNAPGAAGSSDRAAHEVSERIRIANKMLNLASHVVTSLENGPTDRESSAMEQSGDQQQQPGASSPPATSPPPDPEVGLASALTSITTINDRLKPLLDEFSKLVLTKNETKPVQTQEGGAASSSTDSTRQRAVQLSQSIPEVMHHVSHALHNLSDLIVDPNAATTRLTVSPSTVTPVQGVGVYQQVFTMPVVEIAAGGGVSGGVSNSSSQQPSRDSSTSSNTSTSDNAPRPNAPAGPGANQPPFIFMPGAGQRLPGPMFNPFNMAGLFPRPPVAAVITRPPNGQQPAAGQPQGPADQNAAANMVRPIDQNLPCLSRHFLAPHVIEAARLSSQNATLGQAFQQQQQQQQQQQNQPPQPAGQPENANMMNMFQDITNFVMQAIVQAANPAANAANRSGDANTNRPPGTPGQNPTADFVASMQQLAGGVQGNEPFGQIVNSLGQLFADPSGSANRTSAYDFIQGLGNVPPITPSPVNSLIEVIMRSLPMSDFISLVMGNPTPLALVHGPLRQYFNSALEERNSQDVSVIVDPIVDELRTMYDFVFTGTNTLDNIDLVASLIAHDRNWLTRVTQMVVDTPPSVGPVENNNATVYRQLYDIVLNAAHEAVALIVTAIGQDNARPTMRRLVQRAIANMEPGSQVEPTHFAVEALSDFANRLVVDSPRRIPRSVIERYIIRRARTATNEPPARQNPVPVTAASPVPSSLASNSRTTTPSGDVSWIQASAQESARSNVLMAKPANCVENGASGGDWRSVVPMDWVPVIEGDVAKQKAAENISQPPVSDAYLSGLPAKRRRMAMEQRAMDPFAQGQLSRGFSDILGQAVRNTGISPAVAPTLLEEVSSSSELSSLFEGEVIRQLRARLSTDPNFDPTKYPEVASFFGSRQADQ